MPKSNVPAVRKIDSISQVPYRIGYSFRNPELVKPVTKTNTRPYFAMDWAIKGPTQVKEELFKSGKLQRLPEVWRRAAKLNNVEGLGVVGNRRELPSFNELGEAPGPTDKATVTSSTSRDGWGFLDNLIKTAGGVISQSQQLEMAKAQAQAQRTPYSPYGTGQYGVYPSSDGIGALGWAAIIGAVGIGTVLYMRNR